MRLKTDDLQRILRRMGLRSRRRVFGIGLSKTGTVSLTGALNRLGHRVLHYPHDPRTFDELRAGRCKLSVLEDYDGLTDIPTIPIYPALASAYPRARFILTVRDEEDWLRSIETHWRRFPSRADVDADEHMLAFRRWTRQAVYGVTEFDREALRARRTSHEHEVRAFFADSPERLLVMDLCGGEGWARLCTFLGRPQPKKDFPRLHRTNPSP